MEQNMPTIAKKIWGMVRVIFYMVRKGIISKRKLILDINMFLKRGNKLASKAFAHRHVSQFPSSFQEYEFSCSNTPTYTLPFHVNKKGRAVHNMLATNSFFSCAFHAPSTCDEYYDNNNNAMTMSAVKLALEMLQNNSSGNVNDHNIAVEAASPWLPGFGNSPAVRQLRITDSPFPLRDDGCDNGVVDEKAEEFIQRFYTQLRQQKKD